MTRGFPTRDVTLVVGFPAGTPEQFQSEIEREGEMYKGDFQRFGIQPE